MPADAPGPRAVIEAMPKAELHRHLEGCVRTATLIELARGAGKALPSYDEAELDKTVKLRAPMGSLMEVLQMFTLAQAAFVSIEAVERVTREALEDAYHRENVRLLELRYSPDYMLRGAGLDWAEAHAAVVRVLREFERTHPFVGGIILIASRAYGAESAARTVDFALANRDTIVGFDFADNEADYPPTLFVDLVRRLHDAAIPLTVHSGEDTSHHNVVQTVELLSPRRIGHGVRAAEDASGRAIAVLRERGVTVESNPISNWLTHSVPSLEAHPLKRFLDAGLRVSIGADDPQVLDTDLNKEYLASVEKIGLSMEDLRLANRHAVDGSFLEKDKRQEAARLLGLGT